MPLVLMCGIPGSGKSRRAQQLKSYFESEHGKSVVIVSDETADSQPDVLFNDESKEKELRGRLRSESQRRLDKDTLVILDALNYIKGYRYELYCLAKANKTTFCVVQCEASVEDAWRGSSGKYERSTFDALCMRFEGPDSRNRWDSPLFVMQAVDDLPFDVIHAALYLRKAPPAHQSTQSQPLLSTNFLYDLDRVTQGVVQEILEAQKINVPGDEIRLTGGQARLKLVKMFTPMELARLRRQFIVYTKMHPVEDCQKLGNMFVQYLSSGALC